LFLFFRFAVALGEFEEDGEELGVVEGAFEAVDVAVSAVGCAFDADDDLGLFFSTIVAEFGHGFSSFSRVPARAARTTTDSDGAHVRQNVVDSSRLSSVLLMVMVTGSVFPHRVHFISGMLLLP
jgi:hypothetical protein